MTAEARSLNSLLNLGQAPSESAPAKLNKHKKRRSDHLLQAAFLIYLFCFLFNKCHNFFCCTHRKQLVLLDANFFLDKARNFVSGGKKEGALRMKLFSPSPSRNRIEIEMPATSPHDPG